MRDFRDKKIWIIGASSGIGFSLAKELALRGAVLTLSSRREELLQVLGREIGPEHQIKTLDVTNPDAMRMIAHSQDFDGVIYMAGHYNPAQLHNLDMTEVRQIIDVNLNGALNVIDSVYPLFKIKGKGLIALCGSVAGYRGLPNSQPYSATKAAIISLAESLRAEAGKSNVDIRLISPGFVRTPMTGKNKFAMPMMIEPEEAAKSIADGLAGNNFEIHFPRRFTYLMKILASLPYWLYFKMVSK